MTRDDLKKTVGLLLTGGNVQLEVADSALSSIIDVSVRTLLPWYEEKCEETISLKTIGEGKGFYIEDLTHGVVKDILSVELSRGSFESVSDAFGLESDWQLIDIGGNFAEDMLYIRSIKIGLSLTMQWRFLSHLGIVLVDEVPLGADLTVKYSCKIQDVEDVTHPKALAWLEEFAWALTARVVGNVRGKYQSGGLNFELDADSQRQFGDDRLTDLRDQLKLLDFNFCVEGI